MKLPLIPAIFAVACLSTAANAQYSPSGIIQPDGGATAHHVSYTYTIAADADSPAISPPVDVPVSVMGATTTVGYRGVGQVTMLRIKKNFLEWVGLESTSGAAITEGYNSIAGTHIVYVDYSHQVDLQVHSADSFVIHNGAGASRTVVVTMIY